MRSSIQIQGKRRADVKSLILKNVQQQQTAAEMAGKVVETARIPNQDLVGTYTNIHSFLIFLTLMLSVREIQRAFVALDFTGCVGRFEATKRPQLLHFFESNFPSFSELPRTCVSCPFIRHPAIALRRCAVPPLAAVAPSAAKGAESNHEKQKEDG
jgi:hypothetical protein